MKQIRVISLFLCIAVIALLSCSGCQNGTADDSSDMAARYHTLTEHEQAVTNSVESDINTVDDTDYVTVVSDVLANPSKYSGSLLRVEGIYTPPVDKNNDGETSDDDGEYAAIKRVVVEADGARTDLILPVRYFFKTATDGDWVRVMGVVSSLKDDNGDRYAVLDALTIESFAEIGTTELTQS